MQKIFKQFFELNKALIDASSIIYLDKAGFLQQLSETISLITIQEIISETALPDHQIHIISSPVLHLSNYQKLLSLALEQKLPIISEDRKILKALENANMPFFNSLMMLLFLFYKKDFTIAEFLYFKNHLKSVARYSEKIWQFGDAVFLSIKNLS